MTTIHSAPLIILGAGRSGTNALRDAVCDLPGFHTWPCDEINYIWRTGNRSLPTDQFEVSDARPEVRQRIVDAFERRARQEPTSVLVEKTCANSLRPAFVDAVIPNARFVNIVRDGRDVTSSAMGRWVAPLDVRYLLQKARFVPPRDIGFYALRYAKSRFHRRAESDRRLSSWGPRFDGLDGLASAGAPLDLICAEQWAACVRVSLEQLANVPSDRVLTISYEQLTSQPLETIRSVAMFAGVDVTPTELQRVAGSIRGESAGAWQRRLSTEQVERITPVTGPVQSLIDALL